MKTHSIEPASSEWVYDMFVSIFFAMSFYNLLVNLNDRLSIVLNTVLSTNIAVSEIFAVKFAGIFPTPEIQ